MGHGQSLKGKSHLQGRRTSVCPRRTRAASQGHQQEDGAGDSHGAERVKQIVSWLFHSFVCLSWQRLGVINPHVCACTPSALPLRAASENNLFQLQGRVITRRCPAGN